MKKISFIILFILVSVVSAFADMTIYTWGYGDILEVTFVGAKHLTGNGDFRHLFKIFLVITVVFSIVNFGLNATKSDPMRLIKFYLMSMLVWTLFFTSTENVIIDDLQNNNYDTTVQNVPWAVAKPMSWFSTFQKSISETVELAYTGPASLKYSQSGLLSAFSISDAANSHKIRDPYLFMTINGYMTDCVFPDILDGTKDLNTLSSSANLWNDVGDPHPARTSKIYATANPEGTINTCDSVYTNVGGRMTVYVNGQGMTSLANNLGGYATAQLSGLLGSASDYFMGYSVTGQNYLMQAITMNHLNSEYDAWAAANGISGDALSYGLSKSSETAGNSMAIRGALAGRYMPMIKGMLVVIIAGLLPIMALFLVTPLMGKIVVGLGVMFLWLSLWQVGDTILHMVIMTKAAGFLTVSSGGVYSLMNKGIIDTSMLDYVNMAGSFYWMIPTISLLLPTGFSVHGMVQMSGGMGGSVQAPAGGAGGEMATGSASVGNVRYNNTMANSHNTAARYGMGVSRDIGWSSRESYANSTSVAPDMRTGVTNIAGMGTAHVNRSNALPGGAHSVSGFEKDGFKMNYGNVSNGSINFGSGIQANNKEAVDYLQNHTDAGVIDKIEDQHGEVSSVDGVSVQDGRIVEAKRINLANGGYITAAMSGEDGSITSTRYDRDGNAQYTKVDGTSNFMGQSWKSTEEIIDGESTSKMLTRDVNEPVQIGEKFKMTSGTQSVKGGLVTYDGSFQYKNNAGDWEDYSGKISYNTKTGKIDFAKGNKGSEMVEKHVEDDLRSNMSTVRSGTDEYFGASLRLGNTTTEGVILDGDYTTLQKANMFGGDYQRGRTMATQIADGFNKFVSETANTETGARKDARMNAAFNALGFASAGITKSQWGNATDSQRYDMIRNAIVGKYDNLYHDNKGNKEIRFANHVSTMHDEFTDTASYSASERSNDSFRDRDAFGKAVVESESGKPIREQIDKLEATGKHDQKGDFLLGILDKHQRMVQGGTPHPKTGHYGISNDGLNVAVSELRDMYQNKQITDADLNKYNLHEGFKENITGKVFNPFETSKPEFDFKNVKEHMAFIQSMEKNPDGGLFNVEKMKDHNARQVPKSFAEIGKAYAKGEIDDQDLRMYRKETQKTIKEYVNAYENDHPEEFDENLKKK